MHNDMSGFEPSGDKVILKKIDKDLNQMYDRIIIPETIQRNEKLTKATIFKIGNKCKYNMEVGDVVLYDTMSAFEDAFPYVITNEENIIMNLEE